MLGGLKDLFGDGSSPQYTGEEPSVDFQREIYQGQDKMTFDPESMTGGVAESIQMPEAKTFSQRAIQERAQRQYKDALEDMRNRNRMQAIEEQQRQRIQNMDYVAKVKRLVKHVQDRRYVALQNEAAARNRVVGGILGLAGTIGGAALGGIPGAMIGGQIGSGLAGNQQMTRGPQYQQGGFQAQNTNYFSSPSSSFEGPRRG